MSLIISQDAAKSFIFLFWFFSVSHDYIWLGHCLLTLCSKLQQWTSGSNCDLVFVCFLRLLTFSRSPYFPGFSNFCDKEGRQFNILQIYDVSCDSQVDVARCHLLLAFDPSRSLFDTSTPIQLPLLGRCRSLPSAAGIWPVSLLVNRSSPIS
jgi:hypothetical protein